MSKIIAFRAINNKRDFMLALDFHLKRLNASAITGRAFDRLTNPK